MILTVTSHIGLRNFRDHSSPSAALIRALKPENHYLTSVRGWFSSVHGPEFEWITYLHARGSNHGLPAIM